MEKMDLGEAEKDRELDLGNLGMGFGNLWERRAEEGLGFMRRDIVESEN